MAMARPGVIRHNVCGQCSQTFVVRDFGNPRSSRCPVILSCGHPICELCLKNCIKPYIGITCNLCGSLTMPAGEVLEEILDEFNPHMYLMGHMAIFQNRRVINDSNINYVPAGVSAACINKRVMGCDNEGSFDTCYECKFHKSDCYCQNCLASLCNNCWRKIHNASQTLRQHVKVPINKKKKLSKIEKLCQIHKQKLEFFCIGPECQVVICSHCIVDGADGRQTHQGTGHNPILLSQKNKESLEKAEAVSEQAKLKLQRLKHTLKKARPEHYVNGTDFSKLTEIEQEITRYFAQLHGLLQIVEEKALKDLAQSRTIRERSVEQAQKVLETNIQTIKGLMNEIQESTDETSMTCVDLSSLIDQLEKAIDVPCFLVEKKIEHCDGKVELNPDLKELVTKCCELTVPTADFFELKKEEDLPEDYVIESLDKEDASDRSTISDRVSGLRDSPNLFLAPSIAALNTPSVSEPKARRTIAKDTSYQVVVTYIKHPGEFYTMFKADERRRSAIEKRASEFLTKNNEIPEKAEKDELYLVQYSKDGKWYRARVKKVLPVEEGEEKTKNILVYFVDYGNTEDVDLSKLRIMCDKLKEDPPFAMKCQLFDCIPKNETWSIESREQLAVFAKGSLITMYVIDIDRDGTLLVDLSVSKPDEVIGNEVISIRDTMVFLEHANFVRGPTESSSSSNDGKYLNPILPKGGEEFLVTVAHVDSPGEFYVQRLTSEWEYMIRMMMDMERYFEANSKKGMIYAPYIGMPCAAQYKLDKKWYRAEVLDLPGEAKVYIRYVDYGNREKLSYKHIRRLPMDFFKLAPQALRCSVDEIKPKNPKGWIPQSKKFFADIVLAVKSKIIIRGIDKNSLKVLLYKCTDGEQISVNALLVENQFAVATGPNVLTEELAKSNVSRKATPKKNQYTKKNKNKRMTAKELRAKNKKEKDSDDSSEAVEEVDVKVDDKPNDGVIRLECKVLNIHSPALLYVSLVDRAQENKELQKDLNKFYKKKEEVEENKEWKVNDVCAVYCSDIKKWFRGVIHDIINENIVKVFLKDIVRPVEVPISDLRTLDESFVKPMAAYRCHLSGIKPPGNDWPNLSCEFLTDQIEEYSTIFFTRMGDIDWETKSLPIELWVKKVTLGGALDPTKEEWITLNQLLVDQGLAIPVKMPDFTRTMEDFQFDFSINNVDDNERIMWKSYPSIKNPDVSQSDSDSESIFSDPGSSVSAHCVNYSNTFIPSVLADWLPPKPLTENPKNKFNGMPTYVDSNALIYMHDIDDDKKALEKISKELSAVYANSTPTHDDSFWTEGQLCIVRYHLDNEWYRGKVVKVCEDLTYDVLFVDYGNVENCRIVDMRKSVKMVNYPVMCRKYAISGIAANSEDGKWPTEATDYLHALIVDKHCRVTMLEQPPYDVNEPIKIKLVIIEDHTDVATEMLEKKFAVPACESDDSQIDSVTLIDIENPGTVPYLYDSTKKEESTKWYALAQEDHKFKKFVKTRKMEEVTPLITPASKTTPENQEELKYMHLQIPNTCKRFRVEGLAMVNKGEYIEAIATLCKESIPPELCQVFKDFLNMEEEIQVEGPSLPVLQNFKKGTPCCCIFSGDGRWYRAEIKKLHPKDDNLVEVMFVDYGNGELKKKDDLRICKKEWFNVPKFMVKLRLFNLMGNDKIEKSLYNKAYKEFINSVPLGDLVVSIVTRNTDYYEVQIYNDVTGKLAFQEMLDKNVLTFRISPANTPTNTDEDAGE